ncbi:MAG: hypothetical protein ACTSPU_07965, partial [Promethearchaeota archaeon]
VSNKYDDLIKISYVHHYVPNSLVNKYELMNIFNAIFEKDLKINQINKPDQKIDRTLASKYTLLGSLSDKADMKTAITNLKEYMENLKGE